MRHSIFAACAACFIAILSPLAADDVDFDAESMKSIQAKGKEQTSLAGNAHLRMDSADIKADRIDIFGADHQYAFCTGGVSMLDKGLFIQTESLDYDRKKKLSRMQGPTIMEDKENRVVIKGSFVENDGKSETTIIQIGVRILKDDMVCRSEYAFYKRKEKKLELTGLPVVVKGSDTFRAAKIVIDLDTDEISMEGSMSGSVKDKASPSPSATPSASASPDSATTPESAAPSGPPPGASPGATPSPGSPTPPPPRKTP
jgi:lipopolysaccharide export system protein LptA